MSLFSFVVAVSGAISVGAIMLFDLVFKPLYLIVVVVNLLFKFLVELVKLLYAFFVHLKIAPDRPSLRQKAPAIKYPPSPD